MATVAWYLEKTFELIELYECQPCLHNTRHKDYHDRNLRGKAVEEISAALNVPGTCKCTLYMYIRFSEYDIPTHVYMCVTRTKDNSFHAADITKKVKNLRTQYIPERQKTKERKSVTGADEILNGHTLKHLSFLMILLQQRKVHQT